MSQFKLTLVTLLTLLAMIIVGTLIFNPYRIRHDLAIAAILEQDAELAAKRDRATEKQSAARTAAEYVQAMRKLDYSKTPPEFREAFEKHINAWDKSITFLEQHDDVRGEMHELFDKIREKSRNDKMKLESHVAQIFATWEDVEASAKENGVEAE